MIRDCQQAWAVYGPGAYFQNAASGEQLLQYEKTSMNSHDVVVAGSGISGLYCALRLAEAGQRVLVLEASLDRWGGRIETEDMDGFVAEYGPMPACDSNQRFSPDSTALAWNLASG